MGALSVAYPPPSPALRVPPLLALLLLLLLGLAAGTASETASNDSPAAAAAAAAAAAQAAHVASPNDLTSAEAAWLRDADTALLADYLTQTLARAEAGVAAPVPLLYLGDDSDAVDASSSSTADDATASDVWKRSRYYRRYPWKRQPGRGGGVPEFDNPYMCNPTRDDVFQLLVALHEARAGNLGRTVNFCNRRRPAASVFTNIRFLGRRR